MDLIMLIAGEIVIYLADILKQKVR